MPDRFLSSFLGLPCRSLVCLELLRGTRSPCHSLRHSRRETIGDTSRRPSTRLKNGKPSKRSGSCKGFDSHCHTATTGINNGGWGNNFGLNWLMLRLLPATSIHSRNNGFYHSGTPKRHIRTQRGLVKVPFSSEQRSCRNGIGKTKGLIHVWLPCLWRLHPPLDFCHVCTSLLSFAQNSNNLKQDKRHHINYGLDQHTEPRRVSRRVGGIGSANSITDRKSKSVNRVPEHKQIGYAVVWHWHRFTEFRTINWRHVNAMKRLYYLYKGTGSWSSLGLDRPLLFAVSGIVTSLGSDEQPPPLLTSRAPLHFRIPSIHNIVVALLGIWI